MVFINKLSPSRLDVIQQCSLKYRFRYVDYIKLVFNDKVKDTDHLQFGSYLHRVYELGMYCTTVEELLVIAKEERSNYTFFSSRDKEIKKHLMNFLQFANRVRDNVLALEQAVDLPIMDAKGNQVFEMNPKIDLLISGKKGNILIVDFKTGKNEKKQMELLKDNQLRFYVLAVSEMFDLPVSKISASLLYTKSGRLTNPITYTPQSIASFKQRCISEIWNLRKKKKADLTPKLNQFCNWCEFKGLCKIHTRGSVIEENVKTWNEHKAQLKQIVEEKRATDDAARDNKDDK